MAASAAAQRRRSASISAFAAHVRGRRGRGGTPLASCRTGGPPSPPLGSFFHTWRDRVREDGWSRPSAPIRALISGYASPYREKKPLAFLQAFIDDSASEIGDRRLFMAGYVNHAETSVSFADAWAEELKAKPSIKYLKMVEATNLRRIQGMEKDSRDEKIRKLAQTICNFGSILSFDFSINRKTYYEDVRPVAPRGLGNPYFPCSFSVISGVSRFSSTIRRVALQLTSFLMSN